VDAVAEGPSLWVILPPGTRNHFPRDLGLDCRARLRPLDAFLRREVTVDARAFNGHMFEYDRSDAMKDDLWFGSCTQKRHVWKPRVVPEVRAAAR
jgi:hypothetical protein